MKDLGFIIKFTNTMFVLFASIMLLIRWGSYKGNSWREFDYKQLIVEVVLLYAVLFVMVFFSSGDDTTGEWIETPHGGHYVPYE